MHRKYEMDQPVTRKFLSPSVVDVYSSHLKNENQT